MRKCEKAPLLYSLVEKLTFLRPGPASKNCSQKKCVFGRIYRPSFSVHFSNDPGTKVYLLRPPKQVFQVPVGVLPKFYGLPPPPPLRKHGLV